MPLQRQERVFGLFLFNADPHDGANREYEVGDIWEITAEPETSLIPPHNENIIVHEKQRVHTTKDTKDLVSAIELLMPPEDRGSTKTL